MIKKSVVFRLVGGKKKSKSHGGESEETYDCESISCGKIPMQEAEHPVLRRGSQENATDGEKITQKKKKNPPPLCSQGDKLRQKKGEKRKKASGTLNERRSKKQEGGGGLPVRRRSCLAGVVQCRGTSIRNCPEKEGGKYRRKPKESRAYSSTITPKQVRNKKGEKIRKEQIKKNYMDTTKKLTRTTAQKRMNSCTAADQICTW